jgi:YHS domain-containing protein
MVKDPVCKMDVDEKEAKYKSDYKGRTYYFCSSSCKKAFEKEPGKYVKM